MRLIRRNPSQVTVGDDGNERGTDGAQSRSHSRILRTRAPDFIGHGERLRSLAADIQRATEGSRADAPPSCAFACAGVRCRDRRGLHAAIHHHPQRNPDRFCRRDRVDFGLCHLRTHSFFGRPETRQSEKRNQYRGDAGPHPARAASAAWRAGLHRRRARRDCRHRTCQARHLRHHFQPPRPKPADHRLGRECRCRCHYPARWQQGRGHGPRHRQQGRIGHCRAAGGSSPATLERQNSRNHHFVRGNSAGDGRSGDRIFLAIMACQKSR